MLEPLPSDNCKDLKSKVKYFFPTSSSGASFLFISSLEMSKILAYVIRKNPQTTEHIFWIFKDFHRVIQVQSSTCTPSRNFSNGYASREIYMSISFSQKLNHLCKGELFLWELRISENGLHYVCSLPSLVVSVLWVRFLTSTIFSFIWHLV